MMDMPTDYEALAERQPKPEPVNRQPLDWTALTGEPPKREWAIPHWLGFGYLTLLAGPGGVGKTLLAQQLGSALAVGDRFVEAPPKPLKVLMWAGEDDPDELWRRQFQIAGYADHSLAQYANFIVESYVGRDCSLADMVQGTLVQTPMMTELEAQVADYQADVVILDNVARLYGGDENKRHSVTQFVNWVTGACMRRHQTAVLLLSHPAKALGSEYAGSTAWEAAVRSRWYFGRTLPDAEPDATTEGDMNTRWLCRRKSNYASLDAVKMAYDPLYGLLTMDRPEPDGYAPRPLHPARAEGIVVEALRALVGMGVVTSAAPTANNFLVKVMADRGLCKDTNKRELKAALFRLQESKVVTEGELGRRSNGQKKYGLVVSEGCS